MERNQERGNARDTIDALRIATAATIERTGAFGVFFAALVRPTRIEWYEQQRLYLLTLTPRKYHVALLKALSRDEHGEPTAEAAMAYELLLCSNRLSSIAAAVLVGLYAHAFQTVSEETYPNTVVTVGKNEILDKYLAGSSYTAALNMFLKGTTAAIAADTMASHAGWLEVGLANAPAYSGNRPAPAFSSASAGSKAITSAQNFTFTSGGTVAGSCFVQGGSATKDNTTGTLVSAGDFTGGNKTVANTDQLNVSWSLAL